MHGLMMNTPLLTTSLLQFSAKYHADTEVVTVSPKGQITRCTYSNLYKRCKRLAVTLLNLGVKPGDRVGTLAWNSDQHMELYYAIAGIGAVCHTINPRLGDDEIIFILNHAEDKLLFFDSVFENLLGRIRPKLNSIDHIICLKENKYLLSESSEVSVESENVVGPEGSSFSWPDIDENMAASLCYTSGTTGNPKGVLYSHRSIVLHAMCSCLSSSLSFSTDDVILPAVPMFHVNAWGVPYAAPIAGAKLVMPGPNLDGESLFRSMETEGVTIALGVPTVWLSLLEFLELSGKKLSSLKRVIIGGAAVSESMIDEFELKHGINVQHAWGMTETSPIGVVNTLKPKFKNLSRKEQMPVKIKQGRAVYGVEMRIVDDNNQDVDRDGVASGRLLVKGPWIISQYYKTEKTALRADGWFDTGDIATLDPDGYMLITDRAKDIIKSGGEWISSIGLENACTDHPSIKQVAAIGVPHEKWQERPILICIPQTNELPSISEIRTFLDSRVPKMWLPNAIFWVNELPLGPTGKVQKNKLRKSYEDCLLG